MRGSFQPFRPGAERDIVSSMHSLRHPVAIIVLALALAACGERDRPERDTTSATRPAGSPERGLALLEHTPDSLPQ